MQVISFPTPENVVEEHVVAALETALEQAKKGEIASVVVITLDDRGEQDSIGLIGATDGWTQTAGMLLAAQRSI